MHQVVAAAAKAGKTDVFERDTWDCLFDAYRMAVNFDLGDLKPTLEQVEFGRELHEKDMLAFPFPLMFISSKALGQGHSILVSDQVRKMERVGMNDLPDDERAFAMFSTSAVFMGGAIDPKHGPPRQIGNVACPVCGMWVTKDRVNWKHILNLRSASRTTGEPREFSGETYAPHVEFVYGVVAMLMSKDVEVTVSPKPTKLNAAREKKGKVPIGESRIIKIRAEARVRYEGSGDGTHASPRMHWRRGHFRKLASGNIIPVAPSLVNATDEAKEVARKDYEVVA
jgi:hypothetical protein